MSKSETHTISSRVTHFADDATISHIAKLERELAELRMQRDEMSRYLGHIINATIHTSTGAERQEHPAVSSASRQDYSSSSEPGTIGRSDLLDAESENSPVRDSALQPAASAPTTSEKQG